MQAGTDSSVSKSGPLRQSTNSLGKRWSPQVGPLLIYLTIWFCVGAARAQASFFVRYIVSVQEPGSDVLGVRWELAGADEVAAIQLRDPDHSLTNIAGTGRIEANDAGWLWTPEKPYAHISYKVAVNRFRGQQARYDSYAHPQWIITRGRVLFPLALVEYRSTTKPEPARQAILHFQVPSGWQATTPYPRAWTEHTFHVVSTARFPLPRGWIALGRLNRDEREVAGIYFEFARAPGTALDAESLLAFLDATFPLLRRLLPNQRGPWLNRILIVSAPDPMWHGGISGLRSVFLHGDRPLRDVDRTSPILHELFHVLQPFRPAPDADWLVEGLAEFYSLELQRRAGILDHKAYNQALRSFRRYGLWGVDLRQQRDNAATNNSAPLVLYALDQELLRMTGGDRGLDHLIARLAQESRPVNSARVVTLARKVAAKRMDAFFQKHVYRGEPPELTSEGSATAATLAGERPP